MAGILRIISVGVVLAGCGPRLDVAGNWNGRRNIPGEKGADPVIVGNYNRVVLTIKPNGRFDLFDRGFPRSGTWERSGNGVVLTIDQLLGGPIRAGDPKPEPYRLTPTSKDKATLDGPAGKVMLSRESQPSP